jgi:membrane-bound serine protease (ClpP class)
MTRWLHPSKVPLGRCRIIGAAAVAVFLAAVSLQGVASAKEDQPKAEKVAPAEKEPAVQKPPAEADDAAKDRPEMRRIGRVLSVPLPIVSDTDRLVKRFVDRVLEDARKNQYRPVLIFQLDVPPGQDQFGRGSQFGASLELARYLSSDALNAATTVAYIPHSIQGHAVLVALACDEIIMAPDATIGSAGIDEKKIEDFILAGYREIANRRRTVPVELALGMLDPSREVLEVETDVSREFVTPEGLNELRQRRTIAGQKVVIAKGEPGQFTGEEARRLGFVSYLAADRRDAARALELPPESLKEDLALEQEWHAIRVDLKGPLNAEKITQAERLITDAIQQQGVNFICLWIDSPGGSAADSVRLASFLADLSPGKVRTVAYIPSEARADAAVVALACDQVVMGPRAVLGGAGAEAFSDIEIASIRDTIRKVLAPAKSRSWSLPVAMVDPNLAVFQYTNTRLGTVEYFSEEERSEQPEPKQWAPGKRVTTPGVAFRADGATAVDLRLANHTVEDFSQFKALYELENDPTLLEPNWADFLIRAMASPGVAVLLLMIGAAAVYAELHAPGVGVGGFIAAVCFLLFFWSRFLGGTAGWLEAVLFLAGVACLALEVFVIPGFGIFGLGGGAMIIASLILASQTFVLPHNEYQMNQLQTSLTIVGGASLGFIVLAVLMNRWLPRAPFFNRMMLAPLSDEEKEQLSQSESLVDFRRLVGQQGVTTTQLTPSGKARFGDELIDVIAWGELIGKNVTITVVEVHGNRVMVEAV